MLQGAFSFGDFTSCAAYNKSRPEYPHEVVRTVAGMINARQQISRIADIGAGAGKLTSHLQQLAPETIAVEPNDAMRTEGQRQLPAIRWLKGSAEEIPLNDSSVDWICMANAFHFARVSAALGEFSRVLRPGGFLTIIWHVPDLQNDRRERDLQEFVNLLQPNVRRTYLLMENYMRNIDQILGRGSLFEKCIAVSGQSMTMMTRERYLDSWKAVHDIPSQISAGEWESTLSSIKMQVESWPDSFPVIFKCHTFTVRSAS